MLWNKDRRVKAGGFWRCPIKKRESVAKWKREHSVRNRELDAAAKRRKRQKRRDAGVCTECGGPLCSQALCWDCLNRLEGYVGLSF